MSTRNDILDNVKRHTSVKYDMPDLSDTKGITYPDKIVQFVEISKGVGGDAVELKAGENINDIIRSLYPEAKTVVSDLKEITLTTSNPDSLDDPHLLNGTDLAIVRGEIGVAENGSVWIPQNVKHKALYFIAEYLVIVLDKDAIVNNMHEAYRKIGSDQYGYGVFISGPSKTADIEQALVVGAHGAKGVTVILV